MASPPPRRLSPEQAKQVLAKVGDQTITLGDYAAVLERMDRFERLRYQTPERRKALLDDIINLELLAQEAKRRKLDQDPKIQLRLGQALRDEILEDLRASVPSMNQIPETEVREFYHKHLDDFKEPERRRIGAILVKSESLARSLMEQVKAAGPEDWGRLVRKYSERKSPANEQTPLELEGDLGIVSLPGASRGGEPEVPKAVIEAAFELEKLGDVFPKPVWAAPYFYLVRLAGRSEARARSLAEAERSIRARLVEERLDQAERDLMDGLAKKCPVKVNQAAILNAPAPASTARADDPKKVRDVLRP